MHSKLIVFSVVPTPFSHPFCHCITSYVILSSFHPYSSLYIISPLAISSCGTFCALPYTVCLYQFTSSAASKNVVFFFFLLPTAWSKKISLLPFRGCGGYPLHTACFWGVFIIWLPRTEIVKWIIGISRIFERKCFGKQELMKSAVTANHTSFYLLASFLIFHK